MRGKRAVRWAVGELSQEANARSSRKYPICSRGRGGGKFKLRINKPFLEVPEKECFQ